MALLASIATGNFTTAATWGVVDATSYLGAETGSEILTTAGSGTRSSAFTPGAIVVSHIGVKLSVRTGTTGTMSVHLILSSDNSEVVGTLKSINTADLPIAATADANGGWVFFKLSSPVTLLAATAYKIEAWTSSSSQVSLFRDGTTDNISRALITTTTQAPTTGDDMIVAGEYTGAGTSNSFTVTMDNTATTDFGSAPTAANSLLTPGIAVCSKGTLSYGVSASTNYYLKVSNSIIVYSGGTFNIGTVGAEIPRTSTGILEFDPAVDRDYNLFLRNLSTFSSQGLSRSSGKNIVSCLLNTDEAINSTSLGVNTDTGWLDNDEIVVLSTTRTVNQSEKGTLNGDAGASTLTVDGFGGIGGGLASAHSGTSPTQAEVILLTRNVKIRSATSSLVFYISVQPTATVDIKWTEIYYAGSVVSTNFSAVYVATTTGSFNMQYCSLHDSEGSIVNINGDSSSITVSNNVLYLSTGANGLLINSNTSAIISSNIVTRMASGFAGLRILSSTFNGTISNNSFSGNNSRGIEISSGVTLSGTFSGNTIHSNGSDGILIDNSLSNCTFTNTTIWRNSNNGGISFIPSTNLLAVNIIFDGITAFGNTISNIYIAQNASNYGLKIYSLISNGDSSFSTTSGIYLLANSTSELVLDSCSFGSVSGIKTAHTQDINFSSFIFFQIFANNCLFASATEIVAMSNAAIGSFLSSQKHDQTAGLHKTLKKYGTLTIETTTTHTGSQSMKMTPSSATYKLESNSFKVAVANGTTLTPTVYVYEDASYNGNRARLILKRNDAIGITSDTVIDTATAASDAAWEALTGTTAAATDDGVMEFIVDCDGTAGNLFVDSFSVA